MTPAVIDRLNKPMDIDGYRTRPAKCELLSGEDGKYMLGISLWEGRNRQIRKMCEQVGLRVASLKRIAIGELELGNLPRGRWTYLREEEVQYLIGEREHVDDPSD